MVYRTFLALYPLAVVALCSCGGEVPDIQPSSLGIGSQESPEEVFATAIAAAKEDDWRYFASLFTVESQAKMASSLIGGAKFVALSDNDKEQSLSELLDRHGLDLAASMQPNPDASYAEIMLEMFKPVDDIPGIISDLADWMDRNGGESRYGGLSEMRSVEHVSIEGDVAKAVMITDRGELPIEFRKVGKTWLLHLPDDEVEETGAAKSTRPGPAIDTQGTVTGKMSAYLSGEETTFDLKYAVAYRFEHQLAGPPTRVSTWVLLIVDHISSSDIETQLNENEKDPMEAQPFFPDGSYIMMEFDRNGGLIQVYCHALDNHSTMVGPAIAAKGVQNNLVLAAGRVKGEIRLPSDRNSDEVLSFDCKIDVVHFAD